MNPASKSSRWHAPTFLALGAGAIATTAWFALRAAASPTDLSLTFIGWLALLFAFGSVTLCVWSASGPCSIGRAFLGYLLLTLALSAVVLCVGLATHTVTTLDALRLSLVLAAWLVLCSATTTLLRRISPAFSIITTLTLITFFYAGPVTALPLLRAASAASPAQRTLAQCVAAMTPMLASLDAIKSTLLIEWAQLPQMYHLTSAGQDIPMPLPAWWTSALLYIGLALACAIASRLHSPAPKEALAISQG